MNQQNMPQIAVLSDDHLIIEIIKQVFDDVIVISDKNQDTERDIFILDARYNDQTALIDTASILLTELDTVDQFEGLGDGQICLSVPLRVGELVDATMRLHRLYKNEKTVSLGSWTFSPLRRCLVSDQGKPLFLTEKESASLEYIHDHAPVSKVDLMTEVWGYHKDSDTHTVETHIYRLRQKIEENPSEPQILVTEENGYAIRS